MTNANPMLCNSTVTPHGRSSWVAPSVRARLAGWRKAVR